MTLTRDALKIQAPSVSQRPLLLPFVGSPWYNPFSNPLDIEIPLKDIIKIELKRSLNYWFLVKVFTIHYNENGKKNRFMIYLFTPPLTLIDEKPWIEAFRKVGIKVEA